MALLWTTTNFQGSKLNELGDKRPVSRINSKSESLIFLLLSNSLVACLNSYVDKIWFFVVVKVSIVHTLLVDIYLNWRLSGDMLNIRIYMTVFEVRTFMLCSIQNDTKGEKYLCATGKAALGNVPMGLPCRIHAGCDWRQWKGVLLYHLMQGTKRFSEFRRICPGITQRMLTLRRLTA
jgi:hypothetical protein